ncbi:MAG: hypothetical protein ABR907_00405 [Terracidiphilus sp.]
MVHRNPYYHRMPKASIPRRTPHAIERHVHVRVVLIRNIINHVTTTCPVTQQ